MGGEKGTHTVLFRAVGKKTTSTLGAEQGSEQGPELSPGEGQEH